MNIKTYSISEGSSIEPKLNEEFVLTDNKGNSTKCRCSIPEGNKNPCTECVLWEDKLVDCDNIHCSKENREDHTDVVFSPVDSIFKIVAFSGSLEAGKSTSANIAVDYFTDKQYHVYRTAFAKDFKKMGIEFFGFTEEEFYTPEGKNKLNEFWGMTPREFLQRLGQGMRDAICDDVWVKLVERKILTIKRYGMTKKVVIIDDLRYPNEAELVKKYGGTIINIIRPNYSAISAGIVGHPSERSLDSRYIDLTLCNCGTIEQLKHTLTSYLKSQGF